MGKRQPGSVRFDPYFKVQWWDERSMAWRDIQRSHASLPLAEGAAASDVALARAKAGYPAAPGCRYRFMRIDTGGRWPVKEVRP